MTTRSWSTVLDYTTDAGLRAMGSELNAKLAEVGMVQTADTGQVNWTTATRPGGANTIIGYEIWRFNDSLQATAPLYIRLEWYSAPGGATWPTIYMTVGTGTNGAGTLTGTTSTRRPITYTSGGATSSTTAFQSLLCCKDGFLGLAWKYGAAVTATGCFGYTVISRTNDATGAFDTNGFIMEYVLNASNPNNNPVALQSVRTAGTPVVYAGASSVCVVPGNVASSDVSGDKQVYPHWYIDPRARPTIAVCSYVTSELAFSTTFSATLVGSTPRTYIALAASCGCGNNAAGTTPTWGLCMLWE